MSNKPRFSPTICLTHNCNLDCVYCYQQHDTNMRMNFSTAKKCIDWIFDNIPNDMEGVEIGFIGGEPLLEFDLIKQIVEYTCSKAIHKNYIFYATTNGTVLTQEMKDWFIKHKNCFVLGLSLDGTPDTHNKNRCGSFNAIDIAFFRNTWPEQGIKMTLTEYSLQHLAENIKYIHSLGFKEIGGVNLFEGTFDWSSEEYIKILIPQLSELVDFYVDNDHLQIDQMLNRRIAMCEEENRERKKWCGIGTGAIFFDVDGKQWPCPFCTPMTFDEEDLTTICNCDFSRVDDFIDDTCYNECYIYPVCPYCAGANFLTQRSFKIRDKSKCRIQKLITLFSADLIAKRIVKHPDQYEDSIRYHAINAIEKIRSLYLPEFQEYLV